VNSLGVLPNYRPRPRLAATRRWGCGNSYYLHERPDTTEALPTAVIKVCRLRGQHSEVWTTSTGLASANRAPGLITVGYNANNVPGVAEESCSRGAKLGLFKKTPKKCENSDQKKWRRNGPNEVLTYRRPGPRPGRSWSADGHPVILRNDFHVR